MLFPAASNKDDSGFPHSRLFQSPPFGIEKRSSPSLLAMGDDIRWSQSHENDAAQVVIVHDPGLHVSMGTLHPSGSLYERSVDLERAKQEHANFVRVLQKHGMEVYTVRSILAMNCESNMRERLALEDLAFSCLKYVFDPQGEEDPALDKRDEFLLSDEYKAQSIAAMDTEQLVEIVMMNPTITLIKSARDTPLTATGFSFKPLCNLTFTRDQQITTNRGIVMGRMSSPQRHLEIEIMRFCFNKLGLKIAGEVVAPGTLEGGDFFPAGDDLCFIGVGLRTNPAAAKQMMEHDLWGTRRVALVKDLFERSQDRMHLDCVFNIASYDCVAMLDECMGPNSLTRRLVDEWTRADDGSYSLTRHDVEFAQYVREQGYHIIPISAQGQLEYGCNFLNLGNSNIITVHRETARQLARNLHLPLAHIELIEYRSITSMYGSVHCSSQVIRRVAPAPQGSTSQPCLHQLANAPRGTIGPAPAPTGPLSGRVSLVVTRTGSAAQRTNKCIMVAPTSFYHDRSSEMCNFFNQHPTITDRPASRRHLQQQFLLEFSELHSKVVADVGMDVLLFHHEDYEACPNAIFVSNIFTAHHPAELHRPSSEAAMVLYPMRNPDRRNEFRSDALHQLRLRYPDVTDLRNLVDRGLALEGAGSIVLDRARRIAYVAVSARADEAAAKLWAQATGYTLVTFTATDDSRPILHSNTLLCIGDGFAMYCPSLIHPAHRERVSMSLASSGLEIIEVTAAQQRSLATNAVNVSSASGESVLVMSTAAHDSLDEAQRTRLLAHVHRIVHSSIPTIEAVGGGGIAALMGLLF